MISNEQMIRRHEYIGGSDVVIIMGCSKFNTPWDLLLEKSQIKKCDFGGNIYSHIGNSLEGRIQDALNIKNVDEITYKKDIFECHIDGLNEIENEVQEIKVVNQSLNECLRTYEWQIRTYMYVTGLKDARLILLNRNKCSNGYLKRCVSYILKFYNLSFRHDFNNIDCAQEVINDIEFAMNNLKLYNKDLEFKQIKHCQEKQDLLVSKVSKFWDFRQQLIKDKSLINDSTFKSNFMNEFN